MLNKWMYMFPKGFIDMWSTNPASASVPEGGLQPAWRQSGAPVLEHGQQAEKKREKKKIWDEQLKPAVTEQIFALLVNLSTGLMLC